MTHAELRAKVNMLKGSQSQVEQELALARRTYTGNARAARLTAESKTIIQGLAQQAQARLKYKVTSVGTTALQALFRDNRYELGLEILQKGGRTVAPITFLRGPERVPTHPMDNDSGGACYVSAFGLRVANLRLYRPPLRQVLFLDEPGKDINDPTRLMHEEFAELIGRIKDKGMQFVIVTAVQEILGVADKVFRF